MVLLMFLLLLYYCNFVKTLITNMIQAYNYDMPVINILIYLI